MAERAYSAPFTPGDSPGATPAKRRGPRPPYRTREEQDAATQAAAPPATPATPATEEDLFADAIARIDRIQQRAKDSAVLRSTSRAGKQHTEVVRHPGLNPGLPRPIAPGGTEIAPDTETLAAATESMERREMCMIPNTWTSRPVRGSLTTVGLRSSSACGREGDAIRATTFWGARFPAKPIF